MTFFQTVRQQNDTFLVNSNLVTGNIGLRETILLPFISTRGGSFQLSDCSKMNFFASELDRFAQNRSWQNICHCANGT